MRRTDREITDRTEIVNVLSRCDTVRLGMRGEEYPYVVPVSFGIEVADGVPVIYFHCAKEGMKTDLLKKDPRVCVEGDIFIRVERTQRGITARYESVIGFGHCELLTDPANVLHGLKVVTDHYDPQYKVENCPGLERLYIGRIALASLTGKRNLSPVL